MRWLSPNWPKQSKRISSYRISRFFMMMPPRRRQLQSSLWYSSIIFFLFVIAGCAQQSPLTALSVGRYPLFVDDAPTGDLLQAVNRQIDYLERLDPDRATTIDGFRFSVREQIDSLRDFTKIILGESDPLTRGRLISQYFHIFQAAGRNGQGRMLVTGYFEPIYQASLVKQAPYLYPIYRKPDSLVTRINEQSGSRESGRLAPDSTFLPYWTRREVETGNLLHGHELAYLRDPLDAYLLQVQGSGRLRLPDGSLRAVSFAASNGRDYNSLGKLFVDRGLMERQRVSIPAIRTYFSQHPDEVTDMLRHNRLVFFDWGDGSGPRGSLGMPLTPGRSVAIDQQVLPAGVIGYLVTMRPVLDEHGAISHWRPFGRFVVPQDSGSAITGPGRVDLFWGGDGYAEIAAGHMNHRGTLFFLVKKTPATFDSTK
jgi:membrane-bound lytic murein transglycosylase A